RICIRSWCGYSATFYNLSNTVTLSLWGDVTVAGTSVAPF
ncbi:uncharacterized protein METZ01_LOCUS407811, partial [marine metagenome]